jgi:hypothetical protein
MSIMYPSKKRVRIPLQHFIIIPMSLTSVSIPATSRFSNRAENYARFRPGYPDELFLFIEKTLGLSLSSSIVDIGSGTGLFVVLGCGAVEILSAPYFVLVSS